MNRRNQSAPFVSRALCLGFLLCGIAPSAHADRIWWDGTRDTENAPPGKLLSDNEGYWGQSVLTGVEYLYETPLSVPADITGDDPKRFGRRLLDGIPQGLWNVPVDATNGPLVVVFDFKRICTFSEVDIVTQSNKVALKIEFAEAAAGPWRTVLDRPIEKSPEKNLQRIPMGVRVKSSQEAVVSKPSGRLMRLTLAAVAGQATQLNEVLAWGDSQVTPEMPEAFNPVAPTDVITGINFPSIPGVDKSSFSDSEFRNWQQTLGASSRKPAVWSQVATWDNISNKPLLPKMKEIGQPVALTMARNETECAALALTNTSMVNPTGVEVSLGTFTRVGGPKTKGGATPTVIGRLSVAGTLSTRWAGVNIRPLFSVENKIGDSLMQRYLTNAEGIKDFPRLTLSPAGSAVLWLAVDTRGAAPGTYQASLSYKGATGKNESIAVRIEVVDVSLPDTPVWLNTWSGGTNMFPFVYGDRLAREIGYKQSLGVTVWDGMPTPESPAGAARKTGRTISHISILPYHYVNEGFNSRLKPEALTAKDEETIIAYVRAIVKQTEDLGLKYSDWYGELWDEPGRNAPIFGALARIVKKADPKVRLYSNPIFWNGQGIDADEIVYPLLSPWYRELIDVSIPSELFFNGHPKSYQLFDAKRDVNGFYTVSTHGNKGERMAEVEYHRRMAWEAFSRGWNGWGFFAYFRPEANPWTDMDSALPDYSMVYPGPRGPIPTRSSEAVREGWEEYRLLSSLQTRGRKVELAAILKGFKDGEPLTKLRLQALRAAAIAQPKKS